MFARPQRRGEDHDGPSLPQLHPPSSGQALVCGVDSARNPLAARRKLAYIPENVMLDGKLSGLEILADFSALATGVRRGERELRGLLERAGLPAEAIERPQCG